MAAATILKTVKWS